MSDAPIHVTSGYSPTFWAAAGTGLVAFFGLLGVWVKERTPWRKAGIAAEEKMREELMAQNAALTARIEGLESAMEKQAAVREAERALDRHRINNLTQCLDMLIALLETTPEKAASIVMRIKEMREAQMKAEAEEKGKVMAAKIEAAE